MTGNPVSSILTEVGGCALAAVVLAASLIYGEVQGPRVVSDIERDVKAAE